MFDDFEAYFHENVMDSYRNYAKAKRRKIVEKSSDLRFALIAGSALYHLREHLPNNKKQSFSSIVQLCPDYELLGDIVNASKHKILTQRRNSLIHSADDLTEEVISTTYKDRKGEYQHIEKEIFVKLKNGTERIVFEVLTNVMNMWQDFLYKLELIKKIEPITINKEKVPRRTKNSGRLDLRPIHGIRWKGKTRVQKYNYDTKKIEPEDLTNAEITMKIYKQTFTITPIMTNQKTGERFGFTVTIDTKQKKHLDKCATDIECWTYLREIAIEQGVIK